MSEAGYGGDGQGYAGEGISESGQAPDYSGSFMSTSDLPGIDGISSLGAGMLDTAQYAYEPSLINDYSPMNVESTMSMSDIYGEDSLASRMRGFLNNPVLNALSKALPGHMQQMLGITKAATAENPGQFGSKIGGMTGSMVLGSMFGLPGAVVGGLMGSRAGQGMLGGLSQGYSGPSMAGQPGSQGGSPNMDMMTGGLLGLGSLYSGMRNSREISGQLNGLQSLYGQNSPYAQAMRQQLARKDAASGRRSQYGPREVELQARLAQMASGQAPAMVNLLKMQQGNREQTLARLAGLYQKMGGWQGLQSIFNPPSLFQGQNMLENFQLPAEGLSGMSGGLTNGMFTNNPTDGYDFPDIGG